MKKSVEVEMMGWNENFRVVVLFRDEATMGKGAGLHDSAQTKKVEMRLKTMQIRSVGLRMR